MNSVDKKKRLPISNTIARGKRTGNYRGSIALLTALSVGDFIDKQHKTVG